MATCLGEGKIEFKLIVFHLKIDNCTIKSEYYPPPHYIYEPAYWLSGRMFTNGPGDRDPISGRVIPKTEKVVLDTSLHNSLDYKVRIKGKVEQSRERSSALPYTSV